MTAVMPPLGCGPRRLLVAGEDDGACRCIADALRADGYEVVQVSAVGRLLATVVGELDGRPRADSIRLVVAEVGTSLRRGMLTLEHLRLAGWRMPVILVTPPSDTAARADAAALGALMFDKPVDLNGLRAKVARVWKQLER